MLVCSQCRLSTGRIVPHPLQVRTVPRGFWNLQVLAVRKAASQNRSRLADSGWKFSGQPSYVEHDSYRAGVAGALASPLPGTVLDSSRVGQATPLSQCACSTDEEKRPARGREHEGVNPVPALWPAAAPIL